MYYESTRGGMKSALSAEAIKQGIAPDGGLLVPEAKVRLTSDEIADLVGLSYQGRAVKILRKYLDDYTIEELKDCAYKAYSTENFSSPKIAPIHRLNEYVSILELWHGPTCAFKDMALQILPHLLVKALGKTGEKDEIAILVATSGDTGKAALEGFKDVEGTRVMVFFPNQGVSQVQRLQMITQEGNNLEAVAVDGNFDDCQSGLKEIFADAIINEAIAAKGIKLSSANSINWGRLVPQIVYYFSAYADLIESNEIDAGDRINFVVPTGNFGNILAAYYAMEMGLPINKLICASNSNNVLTDFIHTGMYDRQRSLKTTISPSMDILISSNLERLLYEITGHDAQKISGWMNELQTAGSYTVDGDTKKKIARYFWAGFADEIETLKTIESIYKEYDYVVDTHTAVAIDVYDKYVISTGDMTKTVIVSTASPFKFNESVVKAIFSDDAVKEKDEFQLLELLSKECRMNIPQGLKGLNEKEIRHKSQCSKAGIKNQVGKFLGL